MAFPTVPTAAASTVLTGIQANTTATRTFPSLSGLTKNSGDLLIAIVVAYQTSTGTNAAFSGWTGGFTEFHDSATSTTMAIGCAYKWSTGSETGTFAVTQAGTITGQAGLIVMAIPGAHATSPPEAGGRASSTNSNSDPGSLSPSWGAEDTLWIALSGVGETATGGSFQGNIGGPSGWTDYVETGITQDVIGGLGAAVAFLQANATSEDPPTFNTDASNARWGAITIAVRPAPATACRFACPRRVRVRHVHRRWVWRHDQQGHRRGHPLRGGWQRRPDRPTVGWRQRADRHRPNLHYRHGPAHRQFRHYRRHLQPTRDTAGQVLRARHYWARHSCRLYWPDCQLHGVRRENRRCSVHGDSSTRRHRNGREVW